MKQDKERAILETAEEMVRQGGYNCFSFRSIATAVGIKSSSVHYHFATKEDLGVAVTRYYTDNFLDSLGDPQKLFGNNQDPIAIYVAGFRHALLEDKGMCMCGMLGAEAADLPERVVNEIKQFFHHNVEWLEKAYRIKGCEESLIKRKALQTMSTLEGAMLISNASSDLSIFDLSTEHLLLDQFLT